MAPAHAATQTRSGSLSITPGWVIATLDRSPLALPVNVTSPCTITDYGSGFTSTNCDTVNVQLVHPSTPESSGSALTFPADDGTGTGAVATYRVCHAANIASLASCSSSRTL
jgi:hypothetical protein